MRRLASFPAFVWDLVVGDDWLTAAGVVIALGLIALAPAGSPSWLVAPVAVIGLLWHSVRRAKA